MKKIALIGASGFVGSAILKEALDRSIRVQAIVRHPRKIVRKDPILIAVAGDVSDPDTLGRLARGTDAVISAYNPGWSHPELYQETLRTYPAIIEGTKKAGVSRLLIVGGAGSLFTAPGKRLMDEGSIPDALRPGVLALAHVYLEILPGEKELDWVFFSPAARLYHGSRTGRYRLGRDELVRDGEGKSEISVEDYAVAMLDEFEKPVHHRERFTAAY